MGYRVGPQKNVRILLVGERSVGKTSLILSLVSEEFPEDVPPKAEEITIPADVTPEQVPTHIVDYSAAEQSDEILFEEMKKAHVICVVYSVEDEDTLDKVTSKWLPLIRSTLSQSYCPVILVGNKVDLVEYSTIEAVYHIMEEYPEIESCVECSAKTLKNISEMFYYAQKAVLHPTLPLYVMEKQDLTEECKKALIRIFKICDLDNDSLLNDYELNSFQRRCFNAPLQPQVLEDVKAVLRRNISDGVDGDSITLSGFLFLHCLFIQRGRNETTWTVLRKFGYDDSLRMTKEYLRPLIRVPAGASTELSHRGLQFLYWLFERHDHDHDGALNSKEMKSLFSCCPKPAWEDQQLFRMVPTTPDGLLTLQGYICYWVYTTLVDVGRTLEYFGYLGYPIMENDSQLTAIQVTREKRLDLQKKQTNRNVYQCAVTGAPGVGKSAFCRGFLGHKLTQLLEAGDPERQCCTNVVQVYGQEKYLVLREMDLREAIVEGTYDAICLIYDVHNVKSFEQIAKTYLKHFADSKIPVLIVAAKSDLTEIRQDYILQPNAFCSRHRLPPPQPFVSSTTSSVSRDVYVKLATMAAFPNLRRLVHVMLLRSAPSECFDSAIRHLKQLGLMPVDSLGWLKAGLGLMAATAVGFLVVRVLRNTENR